MSERRIRGLLKDTPADDRMVEKLVKEAYRWRNATDIQRAVDRAVVAAYKEGWHQGWMDAPSDEF